MRRFKKSFEFENRTAKRLSLQGMKKTRLFIDKDLDLHTKQSNKQLMTNNGDLDLF